MYRDLEQAVMEAVGIFSLFRWEWANLAGGEDYVPNSDHIRKCFEELRDEAEKEAKVTDTGLTFVSTGRLMVMANYDKKTKELETLYMIELG